MAHIQIIKIKNTVCQVCFTTVNKKQKGLLFTRNFADVDLNYRLWSFGLSSYTDQTLGTDQGLMTRTAEPEPGQKSRASEDLAREPSLRQVTRVGTRKNSALA